MRHLAAILKSLRTWRVVAAVCLLGLGGGLLLREVRADSGATLNYGVGSSLFPVP